MDSDKTIVAPYLDRSIAVSDFENRIWQQCQTVAITHLWSGEPAAAARHAQTRICWSSGALYVRFECVQKEPLVVSPNPVTDRKTLGLWDRDVCEIFLAPEPGNPSRYFEFEAAPTGEWVDLGITLTPNGRETDWDFASGFTTAARVEGEKLLVGMKIPWSAVLPKPDRGTIWKLNLFRCAGPESPDRYLAWQPTRTPEPNFHLAEVFGILRFE